jgi:hypothetical protein
MVSIDTTSIFEFLFLFNFLYPEITSSNAKTNFEDLNTINTFIFLECKSFSVLVHHIIFYLDGPSNKMLH